MFGIGSYRNSKSASFRRVVRAHLAINAYKWDGVIQWYENNVINRKKTANCCPTRFIHSVSLKMRRMLEKTSTRIFVENFHHPASISWVLTEDKARWRRKYNSGVSYYDHVLAFAKRKFEIVTHSSHSISLCNFRSQTILVKLRNNLK